MRPQLTDEQSEERKLSGRIPPSLVGGPFLADILRLFWAETNEILNTSLTRPKGALSYLYEFPSFKKGRFLTNILRHFLTETSSASL